MSVKFRSIVCSDMMAVLTNLEDWDGRGKWKIVVFKTSYSGRV